MNRSYSLSVTLVVLFLSLAAFAEDSPEAKTIQPFALEDQHEKSHSFDFPRERPLVFSVADLGGAKDAPVWTDTIKEKYGDRIEFWSMANLSFIPELARAVARAAMGATTKDLILCDWNGSASAILKAEKGRANIVVVSETGENLLVAFGTVEKEKLAKVYAAIDLVLDRLEAQDGEQSEILPVKDIATK